MPTFHHWQIIDEKYGLKFMTSYEACKFHNKLQKAIEHLARQSKSSKSVFFLKARITYITNQLIGRKVALNRFISH